MKEKDNYNTMGKSSNKRYIWIFTICFALLVKVTAISCLMVYLIDQKLMNDLSGARNGMKDNNKDKPMGEEAVISEDNFLSCTPKSCDPMCIEEWYEGNFSCSLGVNAGPVDYRQQRPTKANHKPKLLSKKKLTTLAGLTNYDRFYREELEPLLIERVSGTPGNVQAREHIIRRLTNLGWTIDQDAFADNTPFGRKNFVNIVATLNPQVERRLVLACHYDSKYFAPREDGGVFIGATDSAVPCAMLLDLAYTLDSILKSNPSEMVTLQLIFFDGEEAFKRWTDTDSLYGSRHLASLMSQTKYPPGNKQGTTELNRMDMLVLLDLIGEQNPQFHNHFPATSKWFQHMQKVESRLKSSNLLSNHVRPYFTTGRSYGGIEDDHIPFLRRDTACFHIIATPFPSVWHKMTDDATALDKDTIDNLNKMLQTFTAEYLHLKLPSKDV